MSDLISRQAVLMSLADYQLQESPNWGANGMGNTDAYEAITECIRVIEQAPTIDPVKHGKWLPHPTDADWDVCSVCGIGTHRRFHYNDAVYGGYDVEESFAYCPNCGAKMEEVR